MRFQYFICQYTKQYKINSICHRLCRTFTCTICLTQTYCVHNVFNISYVFGFSSKNPDLKNLNLIGKFYQEKILDNIVKVDIYVAHSASASVSSISTFLYCLNFSLVLLYNCPHNTINSPWGQAEEGKYRLAPFIYI